MRPDAFSAKKRVVDVDDVRVAYYGEGEGRPLLLLHGCPFSSFVWRKVIPLLAHPALSVPCPGPARLRPLLGMRERIGDASFLPRIVVSVVNGRASAMSGGLLVAALWRLSLALVFDLCRPSA